MTIKNIALIIILVFSITITGCCKYHQAMNKTEMITIPKSQFDKLYSDNEHLLNALEQCMWCTSHK